MRITNSRNSVFFGRPRLSSEPGRRPSHSFPGFSVTTRVYVIPRENSWRPGRATVFDEMQNRSIADSSTGSIAGVIPGDPSSRFSTTSILMRLTLFLPGNSRFSRQPQTSVELQVIDDEWTAVDKLEIGPVLPEAGPRLLRQLPGVSGRDARSADGRFSQARRSARKDVGRHRRRSRRRTGRARPLRPWREPVQHGGPRAALDLATNGAESAVPRVVRETVSLRDLPATIVDVIGLAKGSPFPGRSLTRLWGESSAPADPEVGHEVLSELPGPNRSNSNHGRSPIHRGPLVSLADGDLVYIRNDRDGTEELYNERDDPRELTNQASREAMLPDLQRFRQRLAGLKAGSSVVAP